MHWQMHFYPPPQTRENQGKFENAAFDQPHTRYVCLAAENVCLSAKNVSNPRDYFSSFTAWHIPN
jgi:hypothetical protein